MLIFDWLNIEILETSIMVDKISHSNWFSPNSSNNVNAQAIFFFRIKRIFLQIMIALGFNAKILCSEQSLPRITASK